MKIFQTSITCLLLVLLSACGPTIYKANDLESSKQTVKTLAILPFNVSVEGKRLPKGTSPETLKESLQQTGYDIQNNAYTWLLQRQKNYTVTFQDVDKTNQLLNKANLKYDDIFMQDKGELCKLLNVDAVITGKAVMSRPMSEGAAVAIGVLLGAWGSTNRTTTSLNIHDTTSNLLWKYDYMADGSVGSSTQTLTKFLMKNASKKFPYKSEKK